MATKITYNGQQIASIDETPPVLVTYNNQTIATLSADDTKTLKCNGKVALSDIVVGSKTLKCNGKLMASDIGIAVTVDLVNDVYGDGSYLIITLSPTVSLQNIVEGYLNQTSRALSSVVNIKLISANSEELTATDIAYIHTGLTSLATLDIDCAVADNEIPDEAFKDDTHIQHLKIGVGITRIGTRTFQGSALVDVEGTGVISIGYMAFQDSTSLLKATFVKATDLEYVDEGTSHQTYAFRACTSLKVLEIAYPRKNITSMHDNKRGTLYDCGNAFKLLVIHTENASPDTPMRSFLNGIFCLNSNTPQRDAGYIILVSSNTLNPAGQNLAALSIGKGEENNLYDTGMNEAPSYQYSNTLPENVVWSYHIGENTGLSGIGYGDYAYSTQVAE